MEMEEDPLNPQEVERAKAYWAEEDVDQVFNGVFEYLDHLKRVLKKNTATDKEYVQALKLLKSIDGLPTLSQDASVVQVVIGSGVLLPADSASPSAAPTAGPEELQPPLTPNQLQYHPHLCCKSCLSSLPSRPQCSAPFWGQNPLKVPLLCGFKRLSAVPLMMSLRRRDEGADPAISEDAVDGVEDWDVVYKAPCGQSLRDHDDVLRFLLATESYDILQVDFFTFNPSVRLDPPQPAGPRRPELDLSRGMEPAPVQLCVKDGGTKPAEFRYRKERWPHGCFLTRSPKLFQVCCDCTDGCSDASQCACVAMTTGGRQYSHHRLTEPVPSGVYECGPWCGCVRTRCLNRLVQRGITVRLQVFQTERCGWGVRCRDDLDCGTFVCIYAGVMLRRVHSPTELPPPKLTRIDLPSDDDVEVVSEWLAPPVLEGRSNVLDPPTSSPLHVPVIQRPADNSATAAAGQNRDKAKTVLVGGPQPLSGESGDQKKVSVTTGNPEAAVHSRNGDVTKSLKRSMEEGEDAYFLDAGKEGNVSRFINHSCQPNLFVQNVFTDCHDPAFPVIAFFTNRVVVAGTELSWNYSAAPQSKQDAACLCGSSGCRGQPAAGDEQLCDMCEVKGQEETQ
ncbi:histone-lysine N-methyltransferase SETDB2 [Centropristis striata]|uniref:histone-lysine N-methyltransferase SETDB2 n=1 Tax=Centropristis striata TaxID=184440 RepID=UPI0027E076C2|nr:histone-lysine N-methyltransferase SETDB2 [Centropristis striata]